MRSVVIIGAGITGCFTAYRLAQEGVEAAVVERAEIGDGASGNNPGGLNPLHGPGIPGPMAPLAWHSFQLHLRCQDALSAAAGTDVSIRRVSRIEMALGPDEAALLRKTAELYQAADTFSARWLDRGELLEIEPRCGRAAVGGLLTEGNGMADARAYTVAVARAARRLGATFMTGEVTGVRHRGHRITAALVGERAISCDAIVFATGAWVSGPARWLGLPIPVEPVKGQLLLAEHPGEPFHHHISRQAIGIYHIAGNRVWLGGTQERVGFDTQPTRDAREQILAEAARLVPGIADATVLSHLAALRPMTPDGLPIVGHAPGWDNAFLATGAGTKGFLIGAGMGDIVSALIMGQSAPVDPAPFAPDRF